MSWAHSITRQYTNRNGQQWVLFWVLTLVLHGAFLLFRFEWNLAPSTKKVEIETLAPHQLEQIRRQWKQQDRQFILSKDRSTPDPRALPPENARFESDRNTRVKTEQKAKLTQVIPSKGSTLSSPQTQTLHKPSAPQLPHLAQIGVPLKLSGEALPAGDQYVKETLKEGAENILNTHESRYYSFYARLYQALAPIWQSRTREITYRRFIRPGEYLTVVNVVLDKDGALLAINHLQDSGIPELDQAVDSSWRRINRFPNPPKGMLSSKAEFHMVWTFTVHVDESAGFHYLPPERLD